MNDPVIRAQAAGKRYGTRDVLVDVDLDVRAGQVLGLIGPNGGGKSTLLMLLAGLVSPTDGTVTIDGMPAVDAALQAQGKVGLVTAQSGLYPLLTARENLHYFGGLYGLSPSEIDSRCAPLLEALDVVDAIDRQVGAFSSGMQQKLSLVRALLLSPRALLLDEPTANLDPVSAWTIYDAVRAQAEAGVAVVLCTHDLHAVESLCERVVLLRHRVLATIDQDGNRSAPPRGRLLSLYEEHIT